VRSAAWVLVAAGCAAAGCGKAGKPDPPPAAGPVRITELYTSASNIAKGEKVLLCYGVENARTVWLEPPRRELSAALARCVEVEPAATTTYTLTAEGAGGQSATRSLTLPVGPPLAKIVNVNVSSIAVKAGEPVYICYTVADARAVTIAPLGYAGGPEPKGCALDQPRKSTTYTVTATGAAGNTDQERVTVRVR